MAPLTCTVDTPDYTCDGGDPVTICTYIPSNGNGIIDAETPLFEQCDDDNLDALDGCDATG
jgi:cysteine-rich repeat protein